MSNLQVDSISSMGGGHVDGAGLVVQYVETSDDYVLSTINITSTSWTTTGITLSITPKFIGSKVCVDYKGSLADAQNNTSMDLTLFKDGTQAMGGVGLGYAISRTNNTEYGPVGGQYVFTTTSLSTIALTVYAKTNAVGVGGGSGSPFTAGSSYVFSATEYAQ